MSQPFVSIIVPTKNSAATLRACLQSVRDQSYLNIETVVVDNFSTDNTVNIAKELGAAVYQKGPERSPQRNYGVSKAAGEFVLIIDSDMELGKDVVGQCAAAFADPQVEGVVIPEESFGTGFWAQCKRLERSFYVGVPWMEAARAFRRETYLKLGGYDEAMVSGEDWDLSQRAEAEGKLSRTASFVRHNEGALKFLTTIKKKYYYAKQFKHYQSKNSQTTNVSLQTGLISRYKLFFKQPGKLFSKPLVGVGMLFMKTCEFGAGVVGVLF